MPEEPERPEDLDSAPQTPQGPDTPAEADAPADQPDQPAPEEPVDALGVVEEQELLPEEESTIPRPGEALDDLLPALEVTGHDGVDDALATLDDMADKSVHDHVEVFDAVHQELRRALDQTPEQ